MEEEMATHSSTLAWKIPWMGEPGRLHTVHGVAKSQTLPSNFTFFLSIVPFGEGNGNPLQCSCLENPMDGGPGGPQSMGLQSQTRLSNSHTHTHTHIHTHRQESSTKCKFHFAYIDTLTLPLITKVYVVLKTLY